MKNWGYISWQNRYVFIRILVVCAPQIRVNKNPSIAEKTTSSLAISENVLNVTKAYRELWRPNWGNMIFGIVFSLLYEYNH